MKLILKILEFPFKLIFLFLIYVYKWCISPLLPKVCRYYPSCSSYAVIAIKEHGAFKGLVLACKRILRCNSRCKHGWFDPVPPSIKGDIKWLI
ncbi:MAG: membrane protein insertion efficiency factor YidD [Clostridiales bacterium]|nr:membrane protein insertion efficiency factor YidD [Clostridiales bacterium]